VRHCDSRVLLTSPITRACPWGGGRRRRFGTLFWKCPFHRFRLSPRRPSESFRAVGCCTGRVFLFCKAFGDVVFDLDFPTYLCPETIDDRSILIIRGLSAIFTEWMTHRAGPSRDICGLVVGLGLVSQTLQSKDMFVLENGFLIDVVHHPLLWYVFFLFGRWKLRLPAILTFRD
jgi:hypothetical protein